MSTSHSKIFDGRTLLITGGTGSFGNTVVNRFINSEIAEIRIFSRDEKKQEDMRHALNDERVRFYIGDVRDPGALRDAFRGVDYIFHAAALKQVPSCEFYPMEAVRTNVLGAENVLNAAIAERVKSCVVLSTDKAVYPINAMGLSKALSEKVTVAKSRDIDPAITKFCCTRYGNVMASRGSVIPLFIGQIKAGKNLTVTDPTMTRFMMSLAESVDLVLHAWEHGQQGDILVQKAPACTIEDLARALMMIFDVKRDINVIGTRHGEKVYESLVSREEMSRSDDMGNYYRIPADVRDLNYSKFVKVGDAEIDEFEDFTSHNTYRLSVDEVVDMLLKLDYVNNELRIGSSHLEGV